jgi:hypothetical protein
MYSGVSVDTYIELVFCRKTKKRKRPSRIAPLNLYPFRSCSVLIGILFIGITSEVAVCLLAYSSLVPFRSCSVLIDVLSQLGPLPKLQCGRTLSTGPPSEVSVCLLAYSSLVSLPKLQCSFSIDIPCEVAVCLLTYSLNWAPFRSCSVDVLSQLGPLAKLQCAC